MTDAWPHKGGWGSDEALVKIAKKLNQGNVALVLGAGVSVFYGLPNWKALLSGLENDGAKHTVDELEDYPLWAQTILDDHFAGDELKLTNAVHKGLYGPKESALEIGAIFNNPSLRAIGAIGVGALRGRVDTVVSFNYDSLLESYFCHSGLSVNPVVSENQPTVRSDVAVYHPHGFLPHPETNYAPSNSIVLTTGQYERAVDSPWESTLENLFATRFCIFIGLSGDDESHQCVLEKVHARNEHSKAENYWGYRICRKPDKNTSLWEQRGVYSVECDDLDSGIQDILLKICQYAAKKP